jgi:hypothetical protein
MSKLIIIVFLVSLITYGQEMPKIQFNHLYYILEQTDFNAICESSFISNTLCTSETRADSTATYLYGPSNYLEFFGSSGSDTLLGFSGIAFSVDKIGELNTLKGILNKTNKPTRTNKRDLDGEKVPWFDVLAIVSDSALHSHSRIFLWIMEYRIEYFKHNNYMISDSQLTRENYLEKYASKRANKLLKRFTGVVLKLDSSEKEYIIHFFESIKYQKISENHFVTPENFRFILKERLSDDRKAIESIEFETFTHIVEEKTITISDNVFLVLEENIGRIFFK